VLVQIISLRSPIFIKYDGAASLFTSLSRPHFAFGKNVATSGVVINANISNQSR
jgi:hypothetical protein